jgi:hypothetical protein
MGSYEIATRKHRERKRGENKPSWTGADYLECLHQGTVRRDVLNDSCIANAKECEKSSSFRVHPLGCLPVACNA